jgi:beta-1,4-mannosyl-glycoprotein beta-1,4-N-acetylglucosaminyltransferase
MPKVVNGFPFFNEIRLLHFKLTELADVVDHFVIVESCQTHSGEMKPYYLEEHLETTFAKFRSKIVYVKEDTIIPGPDAWPREINQRNMIIKGIEQLWLDEDDILLIGDLDEIPDAFYTGQLKSRKLCYDGIVRLRQDLYYYNLNCKSVAQFTGLFYALYKDVKFLMYHGITLNKIRRDHLPHTEYIHGWHLSFFGGTDAIRKKLKSFVHHSEYNQDQFTDDFIQDCIKNQKNLFHTQGNQYEAFKYISIHENAYLPKNYKMLLTIES